jgi:hypothetical protein
MVAQYHQILDNEALIINDIGRCASCHQPGEAAAGHDHVYMRVMGHRRAPGVEDGQDADASAKMLGIGCNGEHGLG